jgi:hypothetical protein
MRNKTWKGLQLAAPEPGALATWAAHADPQLKSALQNDLCEKIASDFAQTYFIGPLPDSGFHQICAASVGRSNFELQEFLIGAAFAVNPLPYHDETFYTSDVHALHDDWMNVRSDLGAVWATICEAHDWLEAESGVRSDEYEQQRREAESPKGRRGAETGDASTGDYTSGPE